MRLGIHVCDRLAPVSVSRNGVIAFTKTIAREAALKMLYQLDVREDLEPEQLFAELDELTENEDARRYGRDIVLGARANMSAIDAELEALGTALRDFFSA